MLEVRLEVSKPHIYFQGGKWHVDWRQILNASHPEFERICQQARVWWQVHSQYGLIDGIPVRYKQ